MCQCDPTIKAPWCMKQGCVPPVTGSGAGAPEGQPRRPNDDEMRSHPAYLSALSFAKAQVSTRSSNDSYYVQSKEAAREAWAIYDLLEKEYDEAFKLCVAAGWRFTASHRLLGRAEHMPASTTALPQ